MKSIVLVKIYLLSITILLLLILSIQPSLAYWGYPGDCRDDHGITYFDLPYISEASIQLDGKPTESFWEKATDMGGQVVIPLASQVSLSEGGKPDLLVYLTMTVATNNEYLYILCEWYDDSTDPDDYFVDGLFFCWNISVANFSANFFGQMATESMGGGKVDSWGWFYLTSYEQETPIPNDDLCFADKGWESGSEKRDGQFAFTYEEDVSYTVEFSRKLITEDERDVQFDENKEYLFNMAIHNGGFDEDHAISWTYGLNVTSLIPKTDQAIIDGFNIQLIMLTSVFFVVIIVIKQRKKRLYPDGF